MPAPSPWPQERPRTNLVESRRNPREPSMNPVVHFEIPAEDRNRMAEFYTRVFGWRTQMLGPEMGSYVVVTTTEVDESGRIGSEAPKRRTHSLLRRDKPWSPSGQRHLEPSSETRHKRTGWAKTVGCLLRPPVIVRDAE